jgi:hypothetical protein
VPVKGCLYFRRRLASGRGAGTSQNPPARATAPCCECTVLQPHQRSRHDGSKVYHIAWNCRHTAPLTSTSAGAPRPQKPVLTPSGISSCWLAWVSGISFLPGAYGTIKSFTQKPSPAVLTFSTPYLGGFTVDPSMATIVSSNAGTATVAVRCRSIQHNRCHGGSQRQCNGHSPSMCPSKGKC